MASREKKKSDKRSPKKGDENNNKSKTDITETKTEDNTAESKVSLVEAPSIEKEPTPEPVYDEPSLVERIVSCYEGEKMRGLYEGEGVIHFIDGHSYQGMLSEGYMHGVGFYIWSDGITYQGDFLKNQITGKGKYTWFDGSIYVGDVLNGKRHGFGTFQNSEKTLTYTGDWNQGKKHGKGRLDFDEEGKSYYEGDWVNGLKHGWGIRQYASGNIYQGMWFNNVRHGEGTMKWLDRDQVYIGQWENGIQHGVGQHIWLLHRILKTQYALRNTYCGELVSGKRHGEGTFYYANGAKYEGFWKNNMKQGKGKFTFKNGRTYEGMFMKDHIVEYPDFNMDVAVSPDLSKLRTRTPVVAVESFTLHSNESKNTVSPSFQLDIYNLLASLKNADSEYEVKQVMFSITRHVSALHRIYNFYSMLGCEESPDNTFIMNKMQFWQFLKDIHLHHDIYMLTDMDRAIGAQYEKSRTELHNPYERILQRQFINYLIILAHQIYSKDYYDKKETGPILDYCFSRLMKEKVLCRACNVKSPIYCDTRRAVNAFVHMNQAYEIYQAISTIRKRAPKEPMLKMRQFLLLLKDIGLINEDLTAHAVLKMLKSSNPNVTDNESCYNLELEMTFLEFFEALVGCAEIFVTEKVIMDPTTPRPMLPLLQELSFMSVPPSHLASQEIIEETVEHSAADVILQPTSSLTPLRAASSKEIGNKSTTEVVKGEESPLDILKEAPSKKMSLTGSTQAGLDEAGKNTVSETQHAAEDDYRHASKRQSRADALAHEDHIVEDEESEMDEEGSVSILEEAYAEESEITPEDEETRLLAEATRKFNFWTHQLHIFFVRKFFPKTERHLELKKLVEARRLEEARQRLIMEAAEADAVFLHSEAVMSAMVSHAETPEVHSKVVTPERVASNED